MTIVVIPIADEYKYFQLLKYFDDPNVRKDLAEDTNIEILRKSLREHKEIFIIIKKEDTSNDIELIYNQIDLKTYIKPLGSRFLINHRSIDSKDNIGKLIEKFAIEKVYKENQKQEEFSISGLICYDKFCIAARGSVDLALLNFKGELEKLIEIKSRRITTYHPNIRCHNKKKEEIGMFQLYLTYYLLYRYYKKDIKFLGLDLYLAIKGNNSIPSYNIANYCKSILNLSGFKGNLVYLGKIEIDEGNYEIYRMGTKYLDKSIATEFVETIIKNFIENIKNYI